MRSKFLTEEDVHALLRAAAKKAMKDRQPAKQEALPVSYEQLDALSERIARRISQAMHNRQRQPGRYQGKPEASKPGFQGMYSDEQFRISGLYEREWKRLHGRQ